MKHSNHVVSSPCTSSNCTERVVIANGKKVEIHRTYSLFEVHPEVRRAVIDVHGEHRNVGAAFLDTIAAANLMAVAAESQIIAPLFKTAEDSPLSDDLWWDNWWRGDDSQNIDTKVSSYSIVDYIISVLADKTRYPNLKQITIAGHSSGGDYSARYAVGTQVPQQYPLQYNFVVMNAVPVYLDAYRPALPSITTFAIPATSCKGYDNYSYGMQRLNLYMSRQTLSTMIAQFRARDLTILAGTADTLQDDELETSCESEWTGANRYERMHAYFNYEVARYPNATHRILDVEGVGHDGKAMATSVVGRAVLFPPITVP